MWVVIRGGTNTRPDTSSNRCAKPDSRCLARFSAKGLKYKLTVYFILSVPFFVWALSFLVWEFWRSLPDQLLGYQLAYYFKQNWKQWRNHPIRIGQTWPGPVLISAYAPGPTWTFSVRFTPSCDDLYSYFGENQPISKFKLTSVILKPYWSGNSCHERIENTMLICNSNPPRRLSLDSINVC